MTPPVGLHVAARLEDRFHAVVGRCLRRRGWTPLVTASTAYADADGVHLFLRVLLSPPLPGDQPSGRWRPWGTRRARPPRGWRSLVTMPASGTPVTVTVAGRSHSLTAGRGGYVHAELPMVLAPGWHDATAEVAGREPVGYRVRAVDPAAPRGVISDIDDTILVTWVPRPLLAVWNTFVLRERARRPVPGMAALLRALVGDDGFMFYVSTGAWNFAPHLERFMAEHGFPPGPLLLTDWGPTERGWFRSGAAHKRATLERLRVEHPSARWVLVGDDGQRDPQIYAEFAAAHTDAVRAVAIRQLSVAEHALAAGDRAGTDSRNDADQEASVRRAAVVWVIGADGGDLGVALAARGVIDRWDLSGSGQTTVTR